MKWTSDMFLNFAAPVVGLLLLFSDVILCFPREYGVDLHQSYDAEDRGVFFVESDDDDDILSRHKRSINNTNANTTATTAAPAQPPSSKKYSNAIEEFYADPNNRAMYLVLPLIILVYGGCSSIYCIYKCRRYLKRKRLANQMKDMDRDSPTCSTHIEDQQDSDLITVRTTHCDNNNYPIDVSRPIPIVSKKPVLAEPPMVRTGSRNTLDEEDMPLHDLEEDIDQDKKAEEKKDKEETKETSFTKVSPKPVGMYPRLENQSRNDGSMSSSPGTNKSDRSLLGNEHRAESNQSVERSRSNQPETRSVSKQSDDRRSDDRNLPKVKKFSDLTPKDVEDILNYYNDKKHMPDVIPDDTENMLPIRRKANKWKYRVFNA